jgi:hypothetical protein
MKHKRAQRLEALTAVQHSRLREWRDKWREIALRTSPVDRASAERAIALLYRAIGMAPPRIVWCGSPLSQMLAELIAARLTMRRVGDLEWGATSRQVWESHYQGRTPPHFDDAVWLSVARSVRAAVHDTEVPPALTPELRTSVAMKIWTQTTRESEHRVRASVSGSVWNLVTAHLGGPIRDWISSSVGKPISDATSKLLWEPQPGSPDPDPRRDALFWHLRVQFHASQLAILDYLREVCRLYKETTPVEPLLRLARSAGWASPRRGICWLTDRPCTLRRDETGRLHCVTGPAVAYPDGWQLHFVRGVNVPAEWIEQRERVDPTLALTWPGIEQRRALVEIIGWERVLGSVPTRIVQELRDPSIGTLLECDLPGAPQSRFLRVRCGTGRMFVLPVPRECRTAREANAWTYGLQADEYIPEVRT